MLKELYTAALGMESQQTRLEVTANNMANANTIGFKRSAVFERNLIDAKANLFNVPGDVESDDAPIGSYVDYTAGAFTKTDNPLDIVIENSDGFFVMEDGDGNQFYTKAGSFTISDDGTVTGIDGKILIGAEGPINLSNEFLLGEFNAVDKQSLDIRISDHGEVFVNEQEIGTLMLAKIENPETLEKINNSSFIPTDGTEVKIVASEEVKVKQGWIENSNVDIIKEMIDMIELQRLFETGSKIITTNNDTLESSMQLGRFF